MKVLNFVVVFFFEDGGKEIVFCLCYVGWFVCCGVGFVIWVIKNCCYLNREFENFCCGFRFIGWRVFIEMVGEIEFLFIVLWNEKKLFYFLEVCFFINSWCNGIN